MSRAALLPVIILLILTSARPATAGTVGEIVRKAVDAYGGEKALAMIRAVRETGNVTSAMRGGKTGRIVRVRQPPGMLRVEVTYPGEMAEVRVLNGRRGWRQGREATGPPLDAMVLQEARLGLPLLLRERQEALVYRGTVSHAGRDLAALELPLGGSLSLVVEIDRDTGRIVRSSGRIGGERFGVLEFVTEYRDFREVDGVLFAFREENHAMGMSTGETILEKVELLDRVAEGTFRP